MVLTFLLYVQVSLHSKAAGGFEVFLCRPDPLHQSLDLSSCAFKVVASLIIMHTHNKKACTYLYSTINKSNHHVVLKFHG